VSVITLESVIKADLPARIHEYAAHHFLGKKLALLVSLPVEGPTIYTDSDVLFFSGAHRLAAMFQTPPQSPRYLLDCYPSLDERLLTHDAEKQLPVNAGFLILSGTLDWGGALNRLERLQGDCVFFTEQTLVHLTIRANKGQPLDSEDFVLRAEDQFVYSDYYADRDISARHYVSSIRNKFWHRTNLFY
jgi:hypothetical protein